MFIERMRTDTVGTKSKMYRFLFRKNANFETFICFETDFEQQSTQFDYRMKFSFK